MNANEWYETDVSELIHTIESGSRPSGGASTESGEVPSLGGENIVLSGGVNVNSVRLVPRSFYERMPRGKLRDRDVLINKDGANTGKVGLFRQGELEDACINEHLFLLRGRSDRTTPEYLYYLMLSDTGQEQIRNKISGSAQPGLKSDFIRGFPVRLPGSVAEQSQIAMVLSTVDDAIQHTEAAIEKQKRIKTGLMQDLLTKGIDEHGHIRSEATHEFKDSPMGRIPVGWDASTIDQVACHVGSGITPTGGESVYTPDGVLFIRSQNVHFGGLQLDEVAYIPEHIHQSMLRSEVFENDVLLNITGASIGRCCRMPKIDGNANVNQHVCAIRLRDDTEVRTGLLTAVLESHIGQHQIAQLNAGGNREGLNYQQVRSFVLPWPSGQDECARLYTVMQGIAGYLLSSQSALDKLRVLKTGLMQDLLTGRVSVTPLLCDSIVELTGGPDGVH